MLILLPHSKYKTLEFASVAKEQRTNFSIPLNSLFLLGMWREQNWKVRNLQKNSWDPARQHANQEESQKLNTNCQEGLKTANNYRVSQSKLKIN